MHRLGQESAQPACRRGRNGARDPADLRAGRLRRHRARRGRAGEAPLGRGGGSSEEVEYARECPSRLEGVMNITLWILQVLLALAFLAHGLLFLSPPPEIAVQMNA